MNIVAGCVHTIRSERGAQVVISFADDGRLVIEAKLTDEVAAELGWLRRVEAAARAYVYEADVNDDAGDERRHEALREALAELPLLQRFVETGRL